MNAERLHWVKRIGDIIVGFGIKWNSTIIQEIIQLGIYQFKVRQALEMYQAGVGSLGYMAEKTGLSKQDLIREARARGIEPPFDEQTLLEELGV